MKKHICNAFAFLVFVQLSYGQAAPKEKEKERKWNYNFGIGFLSTKIKNESITTDKTLRTQSKNHPMIELNVSRKLGDLFNFTTGITVQEFSSFTDCIGTFKSSSLLTDEDGFNYYPYYEADFSFERKISVIGIPVGFKLLTGRPGRTSLQIETGIQPSFVISAKLKEEGHYERKGLYPDGTYYNVFYLLEDIPRLNYTHYNVSEETELKTKSFLLNGFVAAGISAPVSAKIDLYVKGYFTTSFNDITADESKDRQYVNLFGEKSEYKKTTLFGAGIVIGILLR